LVGGETMALSPRRLSLVRRLYATPKGRIGGLLMAVVITVAVCAPLIARYDPLQQDLSAGGILQSVSTKHLLGTDELGRDVFSRIVYGSRISLLVAATSVTLAVLVGTILGTSAGSLGRWWDFAIMRFTDALLAFPVLVLAIAISAAINRGVLGLIVAVAVVNVPIFTRLTRAQTLHISEHQYMLAATAMGCGTIDKVAHHVIPNLVNVLIVQATVALSFAIIIEAGLSFLGLGVQAPAPDWGMMISTAEPFMLTAPHMMMAPAGAIFVTVLSLNLLGDALSDALDPRAVLE
jgi:ABC-type dipeptide/oligopeptide/nickel transport system permease subunit